MHCIFPDCTRDIHRLLKDCIKMTVGQERFSVYAYLTIITIVVSQNLFIFSLVSSSKVYTMKRVQTSVSSNNHWMSGSMPGHHNIK